MTFKGPWLQLEQRCRTVAEFLRQGQASFRLRTKLLFSFVFLTAALTSVTLLVVRRNAQEQVERQIESDSRNAVLTIQAVTRNQQTALGRKADLLAWSAFLRDGDPTAIQDASEDPWQSDDCNLFVLADKAARIVALHSRTPQFSTAAAQALISRSVARGENSGWWFSGGGLYQVALYPFYDSLPKKNLLGRVVVGRLMDERAVADLGRITSNDIAFIQDGKVAISTLPPLKEVDLGRKLLDPATKELKLGNEHYHVTAVDLSPGHQPMAQMLVLKSHSEAEAYLQRLNQLLLGLGFVAILVGAALIFLISDTVTQPLAYLLEGVHALERGDMSHSLQASGQDELSELTRAFDGMRCTLRKNEEQREQLESQLRQGQKMEALGRMAGGVAHDFNNLLTVIRGHSDLMLDRLKPEDAFYRNSQQIRKTADRAASLTRQMLAFSRMQVLQPKVLNLNEQIVEMGTLLRRLVREDIEFNLRLADSLARVKADPGQLEQVLLNLTVNASDAMPLGGKLTIETKTVEVTQSFAQTRPTVEPGAYVVMTVSDTGEGMDAATKARIFEPFFTTKKPGKGTGLGLATVYGIVKQSGGFIWIESSPGNGSKFEIYLPQSFEEPEPARVITETTAAIANRKTVLVVEDEADVRELACEYLRAAGYQVVTAQDGLEALETVQRLGKSVHAVLTDIVMPNMRGPALAKQLNSLFPKIRIVYMTGYLDQNSEADSLQNAFFLQKPFSRESLLDKVSEVLQKSPQAKCVEQTTPV